MNKTPTKVPGMDPDTDVIDKSVIPGVPEAEINPGLQERSALKSMAARVLMLTSLALAGIGCAGGINNGGANSGGFSSDSSERGSAVPTVRNPALRDGGVVGDGVDGGDGVPKLNALSLPSLEDLLSDPIFLEMAEEMSTAQEVLVFQLADKFALRYVEERVLPALGLNARQMEVALAVVRGKNFAGATKEGERLAFITLSHLKEGLSRAMISNMIGPESVESRGFNALEVAELNIGVQIADAIGQWYKKWEFEAHDMERSEDRHAAGFVSQWHIVKGDEESGYKEVPYKEIFPEEYAEIGGLLTKMIDDLSDLQGQVLAGDLDIPLENIEAKLKFYTSWKVAHEATEVEGLEGLWREVDTNYVLQLGKNGRIVILFPIETGYGANKSGRIPEYSARVEVIAAEGEDPVGDGIKARQSAIEDDLPELLAGLDMAIENTRGIKAPLLTYFAIRAGLEDVFEIAGQSLPNDEVVVAKVGRLNTMNTIVMNGRVEEGKIIFRKMFGDQYDKELSCINIDDVLVDVAVHEMSHAIGDNGNFIVSAHRNALEEWKSNATDWVLRLGDEDYSEDQLRGAFMAELLSAMRYTQREKEASQNVYFEGWQFFMKTAQEVGLIEVSEAGEWSLDLAGDKLRTFAEEVKDQWLELQEIYEDMNVAKRDGDESSAAKAQARLDAFGAKHVVPTAFIEALRDLFAKMSEEAA